MFVGEHVKSLLVYILHSQYFSSCRCEEYTLNNWESTKRMDSNTISQTMVLGLLLSWKTNRKHAYDLSCGSRLKNGVLLVWRVCLLSMQLTVLSRWRPFPAVLIETRLFTAKMILIKQGEAQLRPHEVWTFLQKYTATYAHCRVFWISPKPRG